MFFKNIIVQLTLLSIKPSANQMTTKQTHNSLAPVYVTYSISTSTQKHIYGAAAYCLNVLKMTALLLGVERLLVEQPEERHVQRGVMSDFTAEHHTLSHCHLHPDGAQLHLHGLWNMNIIHSSAAMSETLNTVTMWKTNELLNYSKIQNCPFVILTRKRENVSNIKFIL